MPPSEPNPILPARPHEVVIALRRPAMIERGAPVLVAFSGGPDSTALLVALREEGHDVVAAHYDHALQPGSGQVAEQVARFCAELGLPLVVERRTSAVPRGSVQAAARSLRYSFLERSGADAGVSTIALAHTADDVVEGSVLHLLRGCGIAGLRGMPARRGPFVRPFLNVWRRDVIDFLRARGISALEDPANSDPHYARVRVRRDVLPALERDRPGITRRFHNVALRAAAMQESIGQLAAPGIGPVTTSVVELGAMSELVRVEALRLIYAEAAGSEPALGRAHLHAMLRLAAGGRGGRGVDLPRGFRFRVVGARAEVVARVQPAMEASLEVRSCPGCNQPGAAHLRPGLELRIGYRRPGLRMRPVGSAGTRKLQDIFVDARVPREERDGWPLVFAGD